MSKAFTKENDGDEFNDEFDDEAAERAAPHSSGKNYITPRGAKRLRDELHQILNVERPKLTETIAWAAGNGDRSENADYIYGKRRLRQIDGRIRFLTKRLEAAEIVDPAQMSGDRVFFGATVTICDEEGEEKTYSIVGVDEIDLDKGQISWLSPLATALLKTREGDVVSFRSPKGVREIEVVKIEYREII